MHPRNAQNMSIFTIHHSLDHGHINYIMCGIRYEPDSIYNNYPTPSE